MIDLLPPSQFCIFDATFSGNNKFLDLTLKCPPLIAAPPMNWPMSSLLCDNIVLCVILITVCRRRRIWSFVQQNGLRPSRRELLAWHKTPTPATVWRAAAAWSGSCEARRVHGRVGDVHVVSLWFQFPGYTQVSALHQHARLHRRTKTTLTLQPIGYLCFCLFRIMSLYYEIKITVSCCIENFGVTCILKLKNSCFISWPV